MGYGCINQTNDERMRKNNLIDGYNEWLFKDLRRRHPFHAPSFDEQI
tara:strand:- start:13564 stop:13704 length:141 start_codon:yes stop_codon:yes gene_type:complete